MQLKDNTYVSQTVERRISPATYAITGALYVCVVLFTVIGTMAGMFWGILAVGTLLFAWYYMGQARDTYEYILEGTHFRVMRTSGFKSRPRVEAFVSTDLTRMEIMGPKDAPALAEIEARTKASSPRRTTYDVSHHDRRDAPMVLYARDGERWLRLTFQPSAELVAAIRRLCPGKVREVEA